MDEGCPNLIDLISKRTQFVVNNNNNRNDDGDERNRQLELRLGLPGDDDHEEQRRSCRKNPVKESYNSQILSLNSFSKQLCCSGMVELQNSEMKKAFSPVTANTAVHNTSQKRSAPGTVVGWPPVRSFRKNIASTSSSKPVPEPDSSIPGKPLNEKRVVENSNKGMFVKINMDGVPIGRKVDLNAYDNYEKLSSSVDALFRGLLAAQRDSSDERSENEEEEHKPIIGLLDGSGEYTLVYEDKEGDRMLVGDVPWDMFLSTVNRLRVLRTSDLPSLSRVGARKIMSR